MKKSTKISLETLNDWVRTLDALEWSINKKIYVKEEIEEFIKKNFTTDKPLKK